MTTASMASTINDPRHWRDRAEEVRLLAEDMKDPTTKATMQRLARDYDHLAERAEQRAKGGQKENRIVSPPSGVLRS